MDSDARRIAEPIDLAVQADWTRAGLRLSPPTRTLHGPAGAQSVEPRVMQVLLALALADGEVRSREALLGAGWGRSIVGDDALSRAIAGARRALREVGAADWQIETIPRIGYRLLAPAGAGVAAPAVAAPAEAPPAPDPPAADAHARPAPARPWLRRRWLLGAAGALAAVGGGALLLARRGPDAQVLALMDEAHAALRRADAEGDRAAVQRLEQAVRQAPQHAPAWGLLAQARRATAEATPPARLPAVLEGVEEAAARALALDAGQPDALLARVQLLPSFGRWTEVDESLRAVLARAPDHLPSLDALALLLASTGVIAAHYPLRLKTVADDPLHAGYNFRAIFSHWMNGQLGAADAAGERGMELWPGHAPTWMARTAVLAGSGRTDRALALLEEALARPEPPLPPPLLARQRLVWSAAVAGPAERAAAVAATLAALERAGPLMAVGATMDFALLGEVELALDVTEAFLLERGPSRVDPAWRPGQPWHLDVRRRFTNHLFLPVTEPLRRHPRFAALMRDIGLAEHWRRSGRAPDHLLRVAG